MKRMVLEGRAFLYNPFHGDAKLHLSLDDGDSWSIGDIVLWALGMRTAKGWWRGLGRVRITIEPIEQGTPEKEQTEQ